MVLEHTVGSWQPDFVETACLPKGILRMDFFGHAFDGPYSGASVQVHKNEPFALIVLRAERIVAQNPVVLSDADDGGPPHSLADQVAAQLHADRTKIADFCRSNPLLVLYSLAGQEDSHTLLTAPSVHYYTSVSAQTRAVAGCTARMYYYDEARDASALCTVHRDFIARQNGHVSERSILQAFDPAKVLVDLQRIYDSERLNGE